MKLKNLNFGLILSLGLLIAVGSYWFVKKVPVEGIEFYIDQMGEKLMALVPQEQEKQDLALKYDQFKEKVREKKVDPEKVEQMAAVIINLSNAKDTLSLIEAESLIDLAIPILRGEEPLLHIEPVPEDWIELNDRLNGVYEFEEQLREKKLTLPREPEITYRVDEDLNVIIDSRMRPELEDEKVLKKLEIENRIIWIDNMEEKLEKNLIQLKARAKLLLKDEKLHKNLLELKIITHQAAGRAILALDSMETIIEIDFDSLEKNIRMDFEFDNPTESE
jgi:hypothetical protein